MAYLQYLSEHVEQITTNQKKKFFLVFGELKALKEAQDEIIKTQKKLGDSRGPVLRFSEMYTI